jgi:NTP pyrophosphatase (non-canonical NTP hydrolase)
LPRTGLATSFAEESGVRTDRGSYRIAEHFQWLTEEQSRSLPTDARDAVTQEIADVFLYLLQLADKLNVDLVEAAHAKLALNAQKYPIERSRGHSRKYDQN